MRLIGPKQKKFWTPGIIMPAGGKFIGSLSANFADLFSTSNVTSGAPTSFDFTLNLPNIAAGNLIVFNLHSSVGNVISSVIFDPAGQNLAMTSEVANVPGMWTAVAGSSIAAGTYTFRVALASSNWQFKTAGIACWYVAGQTSNHPEAIQSAPGGAVLGFGVTAGRAMVASALWTSNTTMPWTSSTVAPSSTHGSGTLLGAAEWGSNLTTTASWTVASAAGNPTSGTIAATFK